MAPSLIGTTTGDPTAPFGFRGTDLGYFVPTRHGYCLSLFGDSFDTPKPSGSGWRSPIILRQSNGDVVTAGPKWDNAVGGRRAKQVVDYTHQTAEDAARRCVDGFTQIPCDAVHLPDGSYLLANFMIRSWNRAGKASWQTWGVRFWRSTETHAEQWGRTVNGDTGRENFDLWNDGKTAKFQNVSFYMDDASGYLYVFGTRQGRYDGDGIYLARVPWSSYSKLSKWQWWGWTGSKWEWGTGVEPTPILSPAQPAGAIGEVNVQAIDGKVVLAYVDYSLAGGSAVTRIADTPDSTWSAPAIHATQATQPNLYAPSVHPYSHFGEGKAAMHLSQWNDSLYGCKAWNITLGDDPTPGEDEADDAGMCVDTRNMTADELVGFLRSSTTVTSEELLAALRGTVS